MPSVKVEKSTSLDANESFQRISQLLENDKELRKLDPKFKCDFNAQERSGSANGGMFKASLKVHETGSGSKVEIAIDLPFHLALAKGMIAKTLERKLSEALA